jgi:predicted secreted protein
MRTVKRGESRLTLRSHERFRVELDALAAAGYTWSVIEKPANVRSLGDRIQFAGPGVGGSALQQFEFEALAPGHMTLEFRYGRPWEAGGERWRLEIAVE